MNKKGFTLIELLVVIAIIGLLSSLAVVSFSSARNKGNDAKIQSDLNQVRTAAELWASDHGGVYTGFTVPTTFTAPSCSTGGYVLTIDGTSGATYSTYADLCGATGYFCVDSAGNAKTQAAVPTSPGSGC